MNAHTLLTFFKMLKKAQLDIFKNNSSVLSSCSLHRLPIWGKKKCARVSYALLH